MLIFANSVFSETVYQYDKYGHKTGSYKTSGNVTTQYDKYGHKTGSYKTDKYGKTTAYDKYGHKTGTFKKK